MKSDPQDPLAAPPGADPERGIQGAERGTRGPGLEPAALVGMAVRFYGLLLLVAWLWRTVWLGEPLLHASAEAAAQGLDPLRDAWVGLFAGGVVIGLSHQLTAHTRGGRALARGLAGLLGPHIQL